MIFVTVGTDRAYGFNRLIEACDLLAPLLPYPVVMQIAASTYEPRNSEFFRYAPVTEYWKRFQESTLVISHCSSGPVLNAKKFEKPLIIMPRRSAYGEFADEHQLDFAHSLEAEKLSAVKIIYETRELEAAIRRMLLENPKPSTQSEGLKKIIAELRGFLDACS